MAQEGNGILDHAFFYDSENHDRVYGADSFEYWLKKFFTTGVFEGEMQVTANNDMTVSAAGGYINIGGKVKFFQTAQVLTIETAHATYDRIDNIVVERNDTERDFILKVVKGGYSSEPEAPVPKRESGIDQRVLAQIRVTHGAVKIMQADITDTRTNRELCGIVTGTVKEYDFQQFQAQFDSYMEVYKKKVAGTYAEYENSLGTYEKEQQALWENWFEHIKEELSQDVAGNLQEQIDDIKENRLPHREENWFHIRGGSDPPTSTYAGPYSVTPQTSEQVLETEGKAMSKNVTVKKVPRYDVSNESGTTVIIGGNEDYGEK